MRRVLVANDRRWRWLGRWWRRRRSAAKEHAKPGPDHAAVCHNALNLDGFSREMKTGPTIDFRDTSAWGEYVRRPDADRGGGSRQDVPHRGACARSAWRGARARAAAAP